MVKIPCISMQMFVGDIFEFIVYTACIQCVVSYNIFLSTGKFQVFA